LLTYYYIHLLVYIAILFVLRASREVRSPIESQFYLSTEQRLAAGEQRAMPRGKKKGQEEAEKVEESLKVERAESREQRAESREQRAESREQRAESREQRADSRDQRPESKRAET
jgi:hypothetical protein